MTITALYNTDILEELRWNSHVFFDVPLEGGTAALDYHNDNGWGYGLLSYLQEDHPTLEVIEIPPHPEWDGTSGAHLLGDMWHWFDENERVWFHGVYTHSVNLGWPAKWYIRQDGFETMTGKLDKWWSEHEEEIPMNGCRTTLWGWGRHHGEVGELSMTAELRKGFLAVLANSEAELVAFWTD